MKRIACVLVGLLAMSGPARAEPLSPDQQRQVMQLIDSYVKSNPQALLDAVEAASKKRQDFEQKDQYDAIKRVGAKRLFADPRDPVEGNINGPDVIVEFIDYACPSCKASFRPLEAYLEQNSRASIRFKQFPILGPESVIAARTALAVNRLDPKAFVVFHRTLLGRTGPLTKEAIDAAVAATGLPTAKVAELASSVQITEQLAEVNDQARLMGLSGTPTFVINKTLFRSIPNSGIINAALANE